VDCAAACSTAAAGAQRVLTLLAEAIVRAVPSARALGAGARRPPLAQLMACITKRLLGVGGGKLALTCLLQQLLAHAALLEVRST
jgi:hypothetical protein